MLATSGTDSEVVDGMTKLALTSDEFNSDY
jgi:hypothetical protein